MYRRDTAAVLTALVTSSVAAQPTVLDANDAGDSYPIVTSPTRLRQSLQDVPASVTIITGETLLSLGITNIADALRLVPGMQITQASGNDYRINYHGTNILSPRRMNVLIDGVSVYQPAFARVDWRSLPVVIEDIDRIEVTRGPNSASYGPNSMLAIVNIITTHPNDVEQSFASATYGSLGTVGLVARVGLNVGRTSVRLTVSKDRDDGYDFLSRIGAGHDSTNLNRLSLRTQTRFDDTTIFDLDAGYVGGVREVPFVEQFQASYPDLDTDNYYLSSTLTKTLSPTHELQLRASFWNNRVRQEWTSCLPTALLLPELATLWRANPAYANALLAERIPSGGSPTDDLLASQAFVAITRLGARAIQPTCGVANQNLVERRVDVELQDTVVFSEKLRAVGGVGLRHQVADSETFLAGRSSNVASWIFANFEYKPLGWLSLNAGAYAEHDRLSGETNTSPRVAANFRLSDTHAMRLVWSSGTRTPDIQEQRADWTYTFAGASPTLNGSSSPGFYQTARSPSGLTSERIRSLELGYLAALPSLGLLVDMKVFDDRLDNLVSEKLQVASFEPTNNGSVRLTGAEAQANVELTNKWTAFANYAYLNNRKASHVTERSQYSRHSGAIGVSQRFGDGWAWSLSYYGASAEGIGQSHYGRQDLTLSKTFELVRSRATASFIVRRLDNKVATYFRDAGSTPESVYDDRLQIFGRLRLSF